MGSKAPPFQMVGRQDLISHDRRRQCIYDIDDTSLALQLHFPSRGSSESLPNWKTYLKKQCRNTHILCQSYILSFTTLQLKYQKQKQHSTSRQCANHSISLPLFQCNGEGK